MASPINSASSLIEISARQNDPRKWLNTLRKQIDRARNVIPLSSDLQNRLRIIEDVVYGAESMAIWLRGRM